MMVDLLMINDGKTNEFWNKLQNTSVSLNSDFNFGYMLLSCHLTISEWIYTAFQVLPECQKTPCLKQAQYLTFKWQQQDSNPQPPSSYMNTQPFSSTI